MKIKENAKQKGNAQNSVVLVLELQKLAMVQWRPICAKEIHALVVQKVSSTKIVWTNVTKYILPKKLISLSYISLVIFIKQRSNKVSVEQMIALLTFQCFKFCWCPEFFLSGTLWQGYMPVKLCLTSMVWYLEPSVGGIYIKNQ